MRHPDVALIVDEVRIVQHARQHRSVVYLMGRTHARLTDGGLLHLPRRYLLEMPFKVELLSCRIISWSCNGCLALCASGVEIVLCSCGSAISAYMLWVAFVRACVHARFTLHACSRQPCARRC